MLATAESLERPLLRGVSHQWMFVAAVPAGAFLIAAARGAAATTAASIYSATLLAVFGTSAAYHRLAKTPRARAVMQRLDHSMIYLLIAGTYVPVCLLALPRSWGIPMLVAVGLGTVTGMVLKLAAFNRVRWLGYALYPVLGWSAIFALPAMLTYLSVGQLSLIVAGGLIYTIGFPVLLTRKPDPWPKVFGYHEVWHACTVLAAIFHFWAVATLVA